MLPCSLEEAACPRLDLRLPAPGTGRSRTAGPRGARLMAVARRTCGVLKAHGSRVAPPWAPTRACCRPQTPGLRHSGSHRGWWCGLHSTSPEARGPLLATALPSPRLHREQGPPALKPPAPLCPVCAFAGHQSRPGSPLGALWPGSPGGVPVLAQGFILPPISSRHPPPHRSVRPSLTEASHPRDTKEAQRAASLLAHLRSCVNLCLHPFLER